MGDGREHVSERFRRLLALYRKPDGSEWGGQELENATGGAVTRSYVANLKNGRIENPGLAKLEAISGAMGFPPALWFGDAGEECLPRRAPPGVARHRQPPCLLPSERVGRQGRDHSQGSRRREV